MRVAHVLRKLDPAEWSGTEMAIHRLLCGLKLQGVNPAVFCPRTPARSPAEADPLVRAGFDVHRFRAFVPVLGLSRARKRQLISVGGNLMSFGLLTSLWRQKNLSLVHTHTLGRLGGIALTVAKRRRIPFVVTIHGGIFDLPDKVKRGFDRPINDGWEWGNLFGFLFQSHRLFRDADAILTCNGQEAALFQESFPGKKIVVQPHGVPLEIYRQDCREAARLAFPQIAGRQVLLNLGRIDPVKNQVWLLDQAPAMFRKHPRAILVLAGPCADEPYGATVTQKIEELGLQDHVLLTGGMPPNDPRLVGLLQSASALLLPSVSETFGIVILEAWAAGTAPISARASGPAALIQHGHNGWLFDLGQPEAFHQALDATLAQPSLVRPMVDRGTRLAQDFGVEALAERLKLLYQHLIEEKQCTM